MTEVAAKLYDEDLSYEERARLRKQRRQESKTQLNIDLKPSSSNAPYSSQRPPTYRNHSSSSPSPSPVTMNGTFNGPISPLVESSSSSNKGLTASKISPVSSNSTINGKTQSHSPVPSTAHPHHQQRTTASSRGEFNRQRYHSTPSESSVDPLKSTPLQASLADSRHQPVAGGVASTTVSGQGPYRHRVNSDTAATVRSQSPHSPVVTKLAAVHLTGIIERQQEREHSCTPSPCTPTQSKFFFPLMDADEDSSSSTSRGTESTLTSEKIKQMSSNEQSSTSLASNTSNSGHSQHRSKTFAEGLKFIDVPNEEHDDKQDFTPTTTTTTSTPAATKSMSTTRTMNTTSSISPSITMKGTATTAATAVSRSPAKTQIVFRPIDEVHDEDITVISGCKFFDPSQSQTDYYTPPPPLHQISSVSEGKAEGQKAEGKDKGKQSKYKESKSPLKPGKKSSSGKLPDETEEKIKNGDQVPKVQRKLSKSKEEKAAKKLIPKKKRSISMSEADVGSGSLPVLISDTTHPPPATTVRKGYSSFRGDGREKSLSPDNTSLSKYSMPNLTSPVHSSSRGTTPDSMSENEEHKRKTSLRNKLKSLMGKEKNTGKAIRASWRFSEVGGVAQSESDVVVSLKGFRRLDEEGEEEVPAGSLQNRISSMASVGSASQLSLLTHKDRLTMLEDTEVVPRTYSMENIYPSYNERCVDVPAIGEKVDKSSTAAGSSNGNTKKDKDVDSVSSSEYLTASDSGSMTKTTSAGEKEKEGLHLSIPATNSSISLSQETSSDKFLTPPENSGPSQTSLELSVIGIMDKVLSCPDTAVTSKTSSSKLVSPLQKTSTKSSTTSKSSSKGLSPRGSPVAGRKGSSSFKLTTATTATGRKTSGSSSPFESSKKQSAASTNSGTDSPSPVKKSNSAVGRTNPRVSPITGRSSASMKKATTSPLAEKRKIASPSTSRRSMSAKSSLPLASPLATRKTSSTKVTPTSSPRSSPVVKRKVTPGSTRSPGQKPTPPMLSKTTLDSTRSSNLGQRSPSFSRFSVGRTPFKLKTDVRENESPAERVQRLKEKRRSRTEQEMVSSSCPTTPQLCASSRRPKVTPPAGLTLSQPTQLESESPHTSGSSSPTTPRKRKLGVSMPSSPMIEIPPTVPEVRTPSPNMPPAEATASQDRVGEKSDTIETSSAPQLKPLDELEFDVNSLLSSVGVKLDQMVDGVGREEEGDIKQPLKLQPDNGGPPPEIASMPAMVFTSPVHSRQSSLDIEGEHDMPTSSHLDVATVPKQASGRNNKPLTGVEKARISSSLAPKSPSAARKVTPSSGPTSKKSKSGGMKVIKTRLSVPIKTTKDQLSPVLEKKETPKSSPSPRLFRKKTSSGGAAQSSSISAGKIESQKFTSARPPRPPMMSRLPSDSVVSLHRASSATTASSSSTGMKRPRNVVAGRPSTAASSSSAAAKPPTPPSSSVSAASTGSEGVKSKSSSALSAGSNKSLPGRSGLRASARAKRISTAATSNSSSQLHSAKPSEVAESSLRRISVGRQSMKTKSATLLRPGSAASTSSRKSSIAGSDIEKASSARKSMRRVSSGELLPRKIKPGASATLNRDRRASQASISGGSSVYASGRASTLSRPSSASTLGLRGTTATRSMRISRGSSGRKSTTTPPRAPMLTRKATPPSTNTLLSPTRKNSMKRTSSAGEVLAAFDHISAQAQGSMLIGSDHRRLVRPKLRQKASQAHLKILGSREGVTTEMPTDDQSKLDPNTYSTYMAKKNLAPSAMAGLAAKLDFTTVKLRKTGIVDKMLAQQAGIDAVSILGSPNPSAGNEHNTVHPVMLLKVKGRRHIQTRLVEPTGASLNSGDVFIAVAENKLFHWVGKSANVIEKARGSDIVMRILHKKELGCTAASPALLKEEESSINSNTRKDTAFWELLGGKRGVKAPDSVPSDEVYEKAVNMATVVYQLEGEGDKAQFVAIHENTAKMLQVSILHPTKILLFDFVNEVYVWLGKRSAPAMRRKAVALGKKIFDAGCCPPVFNLRSSPARQSGRYRPRTSTTSKSPRHSILNASGRRISRVAKSDVKPRPEWALFARTTEGAESILFREKFCDWPEPGRIIKMKGHVSSGEVLPSPPSFELQPADVDKMLKPIPAFEGLRLEGDNIHRGQGNYKVSRSTFACNRVRTNGMTKWVIKEFDNVEVPDQDIGIFYSSESYVIRWAFTITVVRELEGIVPGEGMFARDRKYQRSLQAQQQQQQGRSAAAPADDKDSKAEKRARSDLSDSEGSDVDEDDECKRILESGGRERCAYFFWQGETSTLNEKGASALMTVELDKEKGPQVRVVQGNEPPAFLNLFNGSMIMLKGRSETNSLQSEEKDCRVFSAKFQEKSEACLLEITPDDDNLPLSSFLRSRGCVVFYHIPARKLYLWQGSKSTRSLKKSSYAATKALRNRLVDVDLIIVNEGNESNDFWNLAGDRSLYHSLTSESKAYNYTPRLFELGSATGEFTATEVLFTARGNEVEAFPFHQSDLYSVVQPAIFLLDAHYEVYIWLGWWPEQKNKLLREANATTGSAHARWLRDKKLALQTAQNYVKACNRIRTPRAYMVSAGSEHERFVDLFPFWEVSKSVQELNCKNVIRVVPWRSDVEDELLKYERTRFSLNVLKQRPLPEGVDPARLETYLGDEEFKKIFKVDKEQFATLPLWKQTKAKKEVGLF